MLACEEKGCTLDTLPLYDYQTICPAFEADIYDAISLQTCVAKRNTTGAPGPEALAQEIANDETFLKSIGAYAEY